MNLQGTGECRRCLLDWWQHHQIVHTTFSAKGLNEILFITWSLAAASCVYAQGLLLQWFVWLFAEFWRLTWVDWAEFKQLVRKEELGTEMLRKCRVLSLNCCWKLVKSVAWEWLVFTRAKQVKLVAIDRAWSRVGEAEDVTATTKSCSWMVVTGGLLSKSTRRNKRWCKSTADKGFELDAYSQQYGSRTWGFGRVLMQKVRRRNWWFNESLICCALAAMDCGQVWEIQDSMWKLEMAWINGYRVVLGNGSMVHGSVAVREGFLAKARICFRNQDKQGVRVPIRFYVG